MNCAGSSGFVGSCAWSSVAISCRNELSLIWPLLEVLLLLVELLELVELVELVEFVELLDVAAIGIRFECTP